MTPQERASVEVDANDASLEELEAAADILARAADELDDRDDSPIEWTERTADRWDFDNDPDWR
jgi:hypothetical protein